MPDLNLKKAEERYKKLLELKNIFEIFFHKKCLVFLTEKQKQEQDEKYAPYLRLHFNTAPQNNKPEERKNNTVKNISQSPALQTHSSSCADPKLFKLNNFTKLTASLYKRLDIPPFAHKNSSAYYSPRDYQRELARLEQHIAGARATIILASLATGRKKDREKAESLLASLDDKTLFDVDEEAVKWFSMNYSPENLELLNQLRSYYGLKLCIEEYSIADIDVRTSRRIMFEGALSYLDKEDVPLTPEFLSYRKKYKTSDLIEYPPERYFEEIIRNKALQTGYEEGIRFSERELAETFAKMRIPPEIVAKLNMKDISQIEIMHRTSNRKLSLCEINPDACPNGKREFIWHNIAKYNKPLTKQISRFLRSYGIEKEHIQNMWKGALLIGNPNDANWQYTGKRAYLQIHHLRAIKDGGTNTSNNFVIVVNIPGEINSHKPFHQQDTPSDYFYITATDNGEKLTSAPLGKNSKRIKFITTLSDEIMYGEKGKIVFYGGRTDFLQGKLLDFKKVKANLKRARTIERKNIPEATPENRGQNAMKQLIATSPDQAHFSIKLSKKMRQMSRSFER